MCAHADCHDWLRPKAHTPVRRPVQRLPKIWIVEGGQGSAACAINSGSVRVAAATRLHKTDGTKIIVIVSVIIRPHDAVQALLVFPSYPNDECFTDLQLILEFIRYDRTACRDDNRIERGLFRPASTAVISFECDVVAKCPASGPMRQNWGFG
jgi:hypothetical protein